MSLIVGVIVNDEVSLIADTKLTPGADWATDEPREGLKIYFLSREIAVSYAGAYLPAHDIICDAARRLQDGASLEDLLGRIESKRRDLRLNGRLDPIRIPDFLVAVAGKSPELYRISGDHGFSNVCSVGCIGDNAAASQFKDNLANDASLDRWTVSRRHREIVESSEHATVGGYSVTAWGKVDGFRFLPEMCLISPRATPITDGNWHAIDFGTAETGGFGFISVVPKQIGQNGYGLYFFQGRFGVFYSCDLIKNEFWRRPGYSKSAAGFAKMVAEAVGFETSAFGELG